MLQCLSNERCSVDVEHVEGVVHHDQVGSRAMLEPLNGGAAFLVDRDDFAVEDGPSHRKCLYCGNDGWIITSLIFRVA